MGDPAFPRTRRRRPAASRTCPTEPGPEPKLGGVKRLYGIDRADVRSLALERRADRVGLRLCQDLDSVAAPEPE